MSQEQHEERARANAARVKAAIERARTLGLPIVLPLREEVEAQIDGIVEDAFAGD